MSMMSPSVNLSWDYTPCLGQTETRGLSIFAIPRKAIIVFPYSSTSCCKNGSYIKNGYLKCVYRRDTFICNANSGGHRRNPDFSKLNKNGSRGRNRQNEERDSFDNLNESEIISSRNGPFLPLSNSTKSQATSSTGPKEREIVELFRKVQAKLRERAAAKKEDKRVQEASRGTGKESGTVDSLLKLLRKHSGEQGNRKVSSFRNQEFSTDQSERIDKYSEDQSNQHNGNSLARPPSSFRRKSPVQRFKSQPTYSSEETFDSSSSYNSVWTRKKDPVGLNDEPELESEPEPVSEAELMPNSEYVLEDEGGEVASDDESLQVKADAEADDDADAEADDDADEVIKHEDLNALKLTDLRAIAKSRGVKGFSKMKKAELVDLLSGKSE